MIGQITVYKYGYMLKINEKLFICFDDLIDIDSLASMRPLLSCFLAKNSHLLKPTMYSQTVLGDNTKLGVYDYLKDWQNHFDDDNQLRSRIADLIANDKFGFFLQFEKPVVTGAFTAVPRWSTNYMTKHLRKNCGIRAEDQQLEFFYTWLDRQDIFSDYGRVTFFVNFAGSKSECHRDRIVTDPNDCDEFILLNFYPDSKHFYIFNPDTNQKTYAKGHCIWFNTGNFHGTDPVENACYTLRVDGIFSDHFRNEAGMKQ